MNGRLTIKQARLLKQMLAFKRRREIPPTLREMQAMGGFRSPRSVTQFLEALEAAGYIKRGRGARNIRFVQTEFSSRKEEGIMMGLTIKTLYRFECDHCGKGAPQADDARQARKNAENEGFKISEWMHGECPRQTCFCASCIKRILEEAAKGIAKAESV